MDAYVVIGNNTVHAVCSTPRKAAALAEGLCRDGIPVDVEHFIMNEESVDEPQDTA